MDAGREQCDSPPPVPAEPAPDAPLSPATFTSPSCTSELDSESPTASAATAEIASTSSSPEKDSKMQSPIARLMDRTGYSIVQQNGQRRYGPPPDWEGPPPPRGSEVFVGKIPRDCFEDELVPVFERAGTMYEMRLMMEYSGQNRGYAFVVYSSPAEAKEAAKILNNYEIRKGRTLGICMSVDNCRLFVGGIPKKVTKEDLKAEMQKVTEGVVDVIVYPSASDKTKNRGFAFVEYESHRAAAMARRKLMGSRIQLWGHHIAVDWAEPELEVDEEIMAQVKVLYVRNLMLSTTEQQIDDVFTQHAPVERVKKIRDYAFVHFHSKENAHKAMEAMNGAILDGAEVEVTLAKPVDKDTYPRSPRQKQPFTAVPAFGFVPVDQYGTILPAFYPGYYSPPKYMVRNSMGACTMLRMGGRSPRGGGGRGTRGYYPFASSSPRFVYPGSPVRPQFFSPSQTYYETPKRSPGGLPEELGVGAAAIHAGMLEVQAPPPASTITIKKTTVQILEELCHKSNWGSPLYTLHSSTGGPGEDPLFVYKVTVPALGTTYLPSKLSRSVEEARCIAAEYALIQLGYPLEAATYSHARAIPLPETPPTYTASYVIQNSPKLTTWGAPHDPTAIYAPYPDNPFPTPPAQSYPPPEVYQPTF